MTLTTETKQCSRCELTKPHRDFYSSARSRDGRAWWCKPCQKAYYKGWYEKNGERWRSRMRERGPEYRFGLSRETYEALIATGCAICGTQEGRICLDHDHATGVLRGVLCLKCNTGIGQLRDDPDRVRAALDYLEHGDDRINDLLKDKA